MTRNCPNCGTEILRKAARYCDNCGIELVSFQDDNPTQLPSNLNSGKRDETTRPVSQPDDGPPTKPVLAANDPPTRVVPQATTADEGLIKITDLKTGQTLQNRYRLDRILGKGGFGAVYLAMDTTLNRWCVVKQMLMPKSRSPERLERYRANFAREANLLAQLNHPGHPNIPEIYDYFSDDTGSNYLVMKYIEGRSLKEMLDQGGDLPPLQDILRYAVDLCSALHYMHTHGTEPVMHRDIKPANILLGDDDRVWLVDFGLAKAQPPLDELDERELVTQALGSVGYTPLEQWLGDSRPASDVYALGATLHHVLTGLNPVDAYQGEFNIQKLQQMHGQFIPIRKVNRELSPELEGIIAGATGADPEQRPTALQFQQQLDVFVSGAQDTSIFTFKSGEEARTNGQLVDLCDRYYREAQGYLYRGDFERWFRLTNRNHLAEAATQAVKRGRSQKDGLEKFLKMVVPNLFLRRTYRAGVQFARVGVQFALITAVVLLLLVLVGTLAARFVVQRSIANYPWDFYSMKPDQVNEYSENYLNRVAIEKTEGVLDGVLIDLRAPDQIDVSAGWGGIFLVELPLTVNLVDGRLQFHLANINGVNLPFIANNMAAGINGGVARALQDAPVKITSLTTSDTTLAVGVARNPAVAWNPPPAPAESTTATAEPKETALLAVYNQLPNDVTLEISGQTWQIAANGHKIIEVPAGAHVYTVRTSDGQLTARGQKTWEFGAYKLYLGLDTSQTIDLSD